MTRYAIERDSFGFYGFVVKRWWWPFWTAPYGHWHISIKSAEKAAKRHRDGYPKDFIKEIP